MVIQGHESGVNHNAKSYKEINKWIEDNKRKELCQLDIAATAVPDTHHLHQLEAEGVQPFLESEMKRVTLDGLQVHLQTYAGPSLSSIMVDLLAEGLREACSMISLRTITSGDKHSINSRLIEIYLFNCKFRKLSSNKEMRFNVKT